MHRLWLFCFVVFTSETLAQQSVDDIVASIADEITEIRHDIHANPELSNREFETAKLVEGYLTELGLEVTTGIAHTGVVGLLHGANPGPIVAVRADIDALPVTEDTGFPFASTKTTMFEGKEVGVSHACGHDIHTSVQLGVARTLTELKDEISGTVMFIFQPAEEGAPKGESGGAALMLEEGIFANIKPQAIFALHAFPSLEVGQVGFTSGPTFASSDRFDIKIKGLQSHGAWPHLSADPVVMAAQAVMALQNIRARNLDPRVPAVISIGKINGGERHNIIPGQVELTGTVRTYSGPIQDFIELRMGEILEGITKANGGSYELDYQRNYPPTINSPKLSAWARTSLEKSMSPVNVIDSEPVMGAEDFAFFAQQIPGFYFRLGVRLPGTESGGLHTPTMKADDSSIPVGIKAMTGLVLDFLEQNSEPPAEVDESPVEATETPE